MYIAKLNPWPCTLLGYIVMRWANMVLSVSGFSIPMIRKHIPIVAFSAIFVSL